MNVVNGGLYSRPFVAFIDCLMVNFSSAITSLRHHQQLPPQLSFFSPNYFPSRKFSSSSPSFPWSPSSLRLLPMDKEGSSSPLNGFSKQRSSRHAEAALVSEPSKSGADQMSCESPDFQSAKQFSSQSADDSLPTTADKETRLPCDPAEPSEIKRWQTGGTWFRLPGACLLALHRGDITKWSVDRKTDAIVNAANRGLLGGGGVDGAIHRAAGPELYEECYKLPFKSGHIRCQTGDAVITSGFQLPVSKVIHAVGPIYEDKETSAPLLESAYKNAITVAVQNNIKYLSFPAISCGIYGYPHDAAAEIALTTVQDNAHHLKEIHFVLFEEGPWLSWLSGADKKFEKFSYDQRCT